MPASKVKLLNLGIVLDFLGSPFLEDPAIVHHRDTFDDAQSDIHIVLDDDVADVTRQRGQDMDQISSLGR
jgi:hypothetical protein